jgi:hypothetical protein
LAGALEERDLPSDAAREISRLTNQNIRDFAFGEDVRPGWTWQFFCECGCFTLVEMTLAQYDASSGVWERGHEPTPTLPT